MSYFIDITVHPQSVNATLNSRVNFTCEAVADTITFIVDDEIAGSINNTDRGFVEKSQDTLSDGRKRRVLSAKALENNNNTNISCRAINSETVTSDIAVLRIQGELML